MSLASPGSDGAIADYEEFLKREKYISRREWHAFRYRTKMGPAGATSLDEVLAWAARGTDLAVGATLISCFGSAIGSRFSTRWRIYYRTRLPELARASSSTRMPATSRCVAPAGIGCSARGVAGRRTFQQDPCHRGTHVTGSWTCSVLHSRHPQRIARSPPCCSPRSLICGEVAGSGQRRCW